MKIKHLLIMITSAVLTACSATTSPIVSHSTIHRCADTLNARYPDMGDANWGCHQVAALWTEEDGSEQDYEQFVLTHYAGTSEERDALFNSLQNIMERLYGQADALSVELTRPTMLTNAGEPTDADWIMSEYDTRAHLCDDLFANKIAHLVRLNFRVYTLAEKNENGGNWTRREWAEARLADFFDRRVPAEVAKANTQAVARAGNYIADYNIGMQHLLTADGKKLWEDDRWLLSHWNLRDELKANYASVPNAHERQEMIYEVMLRIVRQEIPAAVVNCPDYDWCPITNKTYQGDKEVALAREDDVRYQHILDIYHAMRQLDAYCPSQPTAIARNFEGDIQISAEEVDSLFRTLLSSPEVHEVAQEISRRLGRQLRPYDIWYDGFKTRASLNQDELTQETRRRYPTPEAFRADMSRMLQVLGFTPETASFLQEHIVVEPARGSGHAWPCVGYGQQARLRTRIAPTGMDYKGYNIAVHEFGHNVEEVLDLYRVDHFMMSGIPNSAFTEASAFIFQARDLMLLGRGKQQMNDNMILDSFWSMVEIMAVSLVDIEMWRWLYAHPEATAAELREAVLTIAAGVWDRYLAADLGEPGCPLLAIYSHMVEVPMYLPNYPIGSVAQFQIEQHLGQCASQAEWAREYERIYSLGRLTPHHWMLQAVGQPLSIDPVLQTVRATLAQ